MKKEGVGLSRWEKGDVGFRRRENCDEGLSRWEMGDVGLRWWKKDDEGLRRWEKDYVE